MHLSGRPVASFDPEGLIFAVGIESKLVKLYDLRSFDKVNFVSIFITILFTFYSLIVWCALFRVHLQHFMFGKTLRSVSGAVSSLVLTAS